MRKLWTLYVKTFILLWKSRGKNFSVVADPDLELRGPEGGGGGLDLLALLACLPSSLQSFLVFLPKIREGGRGSRAPPLDPPLQCSTSVIQYCWSMSSCSPGRPAFHIPKEVSLEMFVENKFGINVMARMLD